MTESGGGSDVANLATTATYDPRTDEIEVHTPTASARKDYIGNAAKDARMAVVFGQLLTPAGAPANNEFVGHGVHAVLMDVRDESGKVVDGVTIEDNGVKGGLPGVDNGTFAFDNVRIPRTLYIPTPLASDSFNRASLGSTDCGRC